MSSTGGPLILLEGLDLAGKSTLTKKMKNALNSHGLRFRESRNSLVASNPVNQCAQSLRLKKTPESKISTLETGSLFLASHLWDIANFELPPVDMLHLQDSSWLRTIAYHSNDFNPTPFLKDSDQCGEWTCDIATLGELANQVMSGTAKGPEFDLVIFLTASAEKRQQRLQKRKQEDPEQCDYDDQQVVRDPTKFMKHDQLLWKVTHDRFPDAKRIDTTDLDETQVFQTVCEFIMKSPLSAYWKCAFQPPPRLELCRALTTGQADYAIAFASPVGAVRTKNDDKVTRMLARASSAPVETLATSVVRVLIVGIGPHARRVYLPALFGSENADAILGVELNSQRGSVNSFLSAKKYDMKMHYIDPFDVNECELPKHIEQEMTKLVKHHGINAVIISTEPLVHRHYSLWALKEGLHILLDKPITARLRAALDLDQARGIWTDFQELSDAYANASLRNDLVFSVNVQRRFHLGFQYVLKRVAEVAKEHQQPVTAIQSFHSDGQLRLPEEMLNVKYHGFNQGHGKISHSGYHLIDVLMHVYRTAADEIEDGRKVATRASVSCVAVEPLGVAQLQTAEDWSRNFRDYQETLQKEPAELLEEFRSGFGEVDAQLQISFEAETGPTLALGSISLIHNGFSRRSWLKPHDDLYKKNGRVKHEHHIIEQGPYQCIIVESYQADDNHDASEEKVAEAYHSGGDKHFDVHIFRNAKLFKQDQQCVYRKLSFQDIRAELQIKEAPTKLLELSREVSEQNPEQKTLFRLPSETSKWRVVTEFIESIRGELIEPGLSSLESHQDGVKLMSSAYESLALRSSSFNSVVSFPLSTAKPKLQVQEVKGPLLSAKAPVILALAQGFLDGGVEFVVHYPGWHSHELHDEIVQEAARRRVAVVDAKMSLNEKVAYQQAFGASVSGKRSVVVMKNYGLNVAADPFLNSHLTGVNAGLVMVVTDDMEVEGSQGQQDSRFYRNFQGGLWLEPTTMEQAYQMASEALEASEQLDLPVVLRLTNEHFRWQELGPFNPRLFETKKDVKEVAVDWKKFVVHPGTWKAQSQNLQRKLVAVQEWVDHCPWVQQPQAPQAAIESQVLHLQVGACRKTVEHQFAIAVGTYPLPSTVISLVAKFGSVEVEENGEYALALLQSKMGEINQLQRLQHLAQPEPDHSSKVIVWSGLEKLFGALKKLSPRHVVADLGQSTRETTNAVTSCLCLGSSPAVAWGVALGQDYPFCISGDASLTHGGGRSLLIEIFASLRDQHLGLCMIIIDNGGSASTGGQALTSNLTQHLPVEMVQSISYSDTSEDRFFSLFKTAQSQKRLVLIHLRV